MNRLEMTFDIYYFKRKRKRKKKRFSIFHKTRNFQLKNIPHEIFLIKNPTRVTRLL